MNYEKIYDSLIQKRLTDKIDRSICYCEYHHIKPRSIYPELENEQSNIIALTLREHFFAHLLLQQIYKTKYGKNSIQYKKMLSAIRYMLDIKKYKIKTSRLYEKIRTAAYDAGIQITTANRIWVTNGKEDILLKPNEQIPNGFWRGRTINFTEEQRQQYSNKISIATKGKKSWNSGKRGIYSDEYRKKISDSHADFSGKNNGRYGSRAMINLETNDVKIVSKDQIDSFIKNGYVIKKHLKKFNNGKIEVMALTCPNGFVKGKLPPVHTEEELKQIKINRRNGMIRRNQRLRVEGRLGNKSGTLTTKGRKWMYNPITNHRIYIKCDDVQKYLDCGYRFGLK